MKERILSDKYHIALEAVEEYCKFRMHERRMPIVKDQGLSVFLQIPHVKCASLFLMDEDTFEFHHAMTLPGENTAESKNVYQMLVDKGIIGSALKNVSISFEKNDITLTDLGYFLALPLLKADGVIGLVILKIDCPPEKLEQAFFMVCNILSGIFAFTLENVILHQKQLESQQTLEQMVAFRTVNLVESKKKLAEKFETLQSNLSMALPHEFRTPINQISGSVDFLLNHYNTVNYDEVSEILEDIKYSAGRLHRLTENYLFYANLSLISNDVLEILNLQTYITHSVNEIINHKVYMLSTAQGRNSDMIVNLEDAPITMSEEYFSKIIEEIIDNALKYSEKGTFIRVNSYIQEAYLVIEVQDGGRGMDNEQIKQIDAYMQFERKVYEQQGSGLGLTIAVKLLDLHSGEFNINSAPGKGTNVRIKIPIARE